MILTYLRQRLAERRSLLLGLGLAVASVTLFIFYRHEVCAVLTFLAGLARAVLPDSLILRLHFPAQEPVSAPVQPGVISAPVQPAVPAITPGVPTMTVATTIAEVLAEAPDFIKLVQDGVAVELAVAKDGFVAGITMAMSFQADIVKVYNDIKALGVSQAVAAGTVTPVPAA